LETLTMDANAGHWRRKLSHLMSLQGRTGRLGFWRVYLLNAILTAISFVLIIVVAMVGGWLAAPLVLLLPVTVWIMIAASIRRLHDRNKSGWWLAIFVAPLYVALFLVEIWSGNGAAIDLGLVLVTVAGLVLTVWGWVEIGFLRGRTEPNRFGPAGIA
jgi:uncharacterized membrane protein YhaH (DUF805 family)